MTENEQENFFVSDSLKDIFDKDDLLEASIEVQARENSESQLLGKFVKLSLESDRFTVSVSPKMAKVLLQNPSTEFTFQFMDEIWILSSSSLEIQQRENGDLHVTLSITGRK